MTIADKVRDEALPCYIITAKISALSSAEIDKYEYLKGEEILLPCQKRVIKQAKFTYSPAGKASKKQLKIT